MKNKARWILATIAAICLVLSGLTLNWFIGVPQIKTGTPQESVSSHLALSDWALGRQIKAIKARISEGEVEVNWNTLDGDGWGYYGIRVGNRCVVPGIPTELTMDGTIPVRVIAGTDETSTVDRIVELNRIAREYASKYNECFHIWLCTN
jgi:hypothetical protein